MPARRKGTWEIRQRWKNGDRYLAWGDGPTEQCADEVYTPDAKSFAFVVFSFVHMNFILSIEENHDCTSMAYCEWPTSKKKNW